jgi:uncharacterized membrane protein
MGIVLRAIAGWGCVALPAFSLSELVYWTMDNSLFGATSHRAITVFGLLDSIVSPLVYFCVAFLFLSIFLRLLRSEKMWQKMQRFAEKE